MNIPSLISHIAQKPLTYAKKSIQIGANAIAKTDFFCSRISKLQKKNGIIGLSKEIIKHLESLPIDDFIIKSKEIILKSLNCPSELEPVMCKMDLQNKELGAIYTPGFNQIAINTGAPAINNKRILLSNIRHELEHFMQNLKVLRTEETAQKAVNKYAEVSSEAITTDFINIYKDIPKDEILKGLKDGLITDVGVKNIKNLKKAIKNGELDTFKKSFYDQILTERLEAWANYAKEAQKLLGIIKPGTKEAINAQKYLASFTDKNYKPGIISGLKYKTERDAYFKQLLSIYEYIIMKYLG